MHVNVTSVYSRFLRELGTGKIRPGDRLGEPTLATRWKVSRSSVRDALIRLECEGLVERRPQSGTYVRVMDREEVEELYQLRGLVEGFVVQKVVETVTDDQLDELERLALEADACDSQSMTAEEIIGRESRFHLKLYETANLRHIQRIFNIQHLLLRTLYLTSRDDAGHPSRIHGDLVAALRSRDSRRCERLVKQVTKASIRELRKRSAQSENLGSTGSCHPNGNSHKGKLRRLQPGKARCVSNGKQIVGTE